MTTTIFTSEYVTWTNIVIPTDDDINQLQERYPQFHQLNLNDCMTDLEFPKLDHHDGYIFLVTQFPRWDVESLICQPAEIDIFVSKGVLVTSHQADLKPLNDLFDRVQNDPTAHEQLMLHGASPLLYEVLNVLVQYCYPILQKVNQKIRHIEQNLFNADTHHILQEVALARRDIISLRHILIPQIKVIYELERGEWRFIHDDLDIYWGDIGDHLEQIKSMLDEQREVIDGLSETIDTLASHRIDEVVRLLTLITLISVPITVIATIFGMNMALPYGNHPLAFYAINAIAIGVTLTFIWHLRRKHWL
ncbi:MAG: magnesium transporter CorA family protein [Chloroflexi bacterium]|nr:magnesium transporter CorA family protein [Chloroflexota bacterium]